MSAECPIPGYLDRGYEHRGRIEKVRLLIHIKLSLSVYCVPPPIARSARPPTSKGILINMSAAADQNPEKYTAGLRKGFPGQGHPGEISRNELAIFQASLGEAETWMRVWKKVSLGSTNSSIRTCKNFGRSWPNVTLATMQRGTHTL